MLITDRSTGRRYQLRKRHSAKGNHLNTRTGERYYLVKVYL